MNYKTDNEYFKESTLFRCTCGDYEFFEIIKLDDDNQTNYSVSLVSCPCSFWDRLRYLFREEQHVKEIILNQTDIIELRDNINALIKEKDKDKLNQTGEEDE